MRRVWLGLVTLWISSAAVSVEAQALKPNDKYVCSWGAGTAARAQELKLAHVSRYAARKKLQTLKFSKAWMRMMAIGITEQTYDSSSRARPAAIRQAFYDQCISYKTARR